MTAREAHANIAGLNIVFGAVLGFVLASTESMTTRDYVVTLFTAATIAITILYISHSPRRLMYALVGIGLVAALPFILNDNYISPASRVPEKLQPTFAVWLVMTLMIKFWPRTKPVDFSRKPDEMES